MKHNDNESTNKSPSPLPEFVGITSSEVDTEEHKHISRKSKRVIVKWTNEENNRYYNDIFWESYKNQSTPKETEELKKLNLYSKTRTGLK